MPRWRSSRWKGAALLAGQLALFALPVLAWQIASHGYVDPMMISTPLEVLRQTMTWTARGVLQQAVLDTFRMVCLGLFGGAIAGCVVGIVAGSVRIIETLLEPVITMVFAIPKVALIPLFILWFGTGDELKFAITLISVFFFFYYATERGVRGLPPALDNMLRLTGAGWLQRVHLLYLPASVGWLLSGLRVALPYAFVSVISAEIVAARGGLGALAKNSAAVMNPAGLFAATITLTVLGAATSGLAIWLVGRTRWALDEKSR